MNVQGHSSKFWTVPPTSRSLSLQAIVFCIEIKPTMSRMQNSDSYHLLEWQRPPCRENQLKGITCSSSLDNFRAIIDWTVNDFPNCLFPGLGTVIFIGGLNDLKNDIFEGRGRHYGARSSWILWIFEDLGMFFTRDLNQTYSPKRRKRSLFMLSSEGYICPPPFVSWLALFRHRRAQGILSLVIDHFWRKMLETCTCTSMYVQTGRSSVIHWTSTIQEWRSPKADQLRAT